MPFRWSRLSILPAAVLLLAAGGLARAQEPVATKAAPQRLVLTTSVPQARAAFDAALVEVLNVGGRRADVALKRAVQLDSSAGLARAMYAMWASGLPQAERMRQMDRAVVDAARATPGELLTVAGMREALRGDDATARALIRAARLTLPDDPYLAFGDIANEMMVLGNAAEAVRLARAYLERNPGEASIQNQLGYALLDAGKQAEGLDAIRRYAQMLPNHPNSHDSYGEILQKMGRLDEAEREYKRAVELDPGFTEAYNGLAEVAQLRRDYASAGTHLEGSLAHAVAPEDRIAAMRALAYNAVFAGEKQKVRDQLLAAATEADEAGMPASAAASRGYLAILEASAGDAATATADLARVKPVIAWNAPVWSAFVHGSLGNVAGVRSDLEALQKATEQSPDVVPDALPLVRLIDAVLREDIPGARAELAAVKQPGYRVVAQAFLLRGALLKNDAATVNAAQAELAAYRSIDINSAFAHRLVGEP